MFWKSKKAEIQELREQLAASERRVAELNSVADSAISNMKRAEEALQREKVSAGMARADKAIAEAHTEIVRRQLAAQIDTHERYRLVVPGGTASITAACRKQREEAHRRAQLQAAGTLADALGHAALRGGLYG